VNEYILAPFSRQTESFHPPCRIGHLAAYQQRLGLVVLAWRAQTLLLIAVLTKNTYTGWGGQLWTKMFFFNAFRPSCLIEGYFRHEKYWLVWASPFANHLNNFYFIILSDGLTVVAERVACFADLDRR
jgi:hypothetical protein